MEVIHGERKCGPDDMFVQLIGGPFDGSIAVVIKRATHIATGGDENQHHYRRRDSNPNLFDYESKRPIDKDMKVFRHPDFFPGSA